MAVEHLDVTQVVQCKALVQVHIQELASTLAKSKKKRNLKNLLNSPQSK